MISAERLEKAITFLAETDASAAELLATMERDEFRAKAIKDALFVHDKDGTVADRAARAGSSKEYEEAMGLYFSAVQDYNSVKNKRQTESLIVDVWRSLNSARSKGIL